jgi:hypothetical protein
MKPTLLSIGRVEMYLPRKSCVGNSLPFVSLDFREPRHFAVVGNFGDEFSFLPFKFCTLFGCKPGPRNLQIRNDKTAKFLESSNLEFNGLLCFEVFRRPILSEP